MSDRIFVDYTPSKEGSISIEDLISDDSGHEEFRESVCALVDFVREHPYCGTTEILKPALASLAFNTPLEINVASWAYNFDDIRMHQMMTAIQLRSGKKWPIDYVPDSEIRGWIGV